MFYLEQFNKIGLVVWRNFGTFVEFWVSMFLLFNVSFLFLTKQNDEMKSIIQVPTIVCAICWITENNLVLCLTKFTGKNIFGLESSKIKYLF